MAVEKGNSNAMNSLGVYYLKQNNIPEMLKYYQMASEKGNDLAMNNLGNYYKEQNNIPEILKYYQMAIEKINNLEEKKIKEIITFSLTNNTKMLFMNLYSKYKHHPVFAKFHNFYMPRKQFGKTDSCQICMEECEIIPYDCFWHGYCVICTLKIDKCSICKIHKSIDYVNIF